MTAAELPESLDRHFMAGCPSLSTSQLAEHEASEACPECSERARETAARDAESEFWGTLAHMHQQRDVQLQAEINRLRPLALGRREAMTGSIGAAADG